MSVKALITGITGQDGSFLAEQLLAEGAEVHGIVRRSSSFNTERIDHLYDDPHEPHARLRLHYGDLTDAASIEATIARVEPDEIYHLGAQSHVRVSFDIPSYTVDSIVSGTLNMLEATRRIAPRAHFYQASSSEMFGAAIAPQSEETPFQPRSPYACAKVCAFELVRTYRDAYNLFACNGILFNHESERRPETFVTRKITAAVARIHAGRQSKLFLGNLTARRDWGYAPEYTAMMPKMLRADQPDDYCLGTGQDHTVQRFVEEAFSCVGLDWHEYIANDPRYHRPAEVNHLLCDPSYAARKLGWYPMTKFPQLVRRMVAYDMERVS